MIRMRTTLDLPDGLVDEAREVAGFTSKTDTVVYALREVVRRKRKEDLMTLLCRIDFGDAPAEMRRKARARARAAV
jgi:Arc/MetJ family transcription regulator